MAASSIGMGYGIYIINNTSLYFCIYNPTQLIAGNQHWGHATSKDLYAWQNQPIALSGDAGEQIFSGSIVIDEENTSGLFTNATFPAGVKYGVVAIYTRNQASKQTQWIASSTDGGYTWAGYPHNPVDSTSNQFRDPKVIRYQNQWVMVIAYSQDFTVGIWTSPDLITWTPKSNFSHHGLLGLQWECPNLVEIPMDQGKNMWVLTVSINPGAPLDGSIMQYFPCSFDGTQFVAVDDAARIADFGKDNYAGQYFYGVPDSQALVMIAWASNWQYCDEVPTATEGWRSAMSLPRQTRLHNSTRIGYDLISIPYTLNAVPQTTVYQSTSYHWKNNPLVISPSQWPAGVLHFTVVLTRIPTDGSANGALLFNLSSSTTHESVAGGYNITGDTPFWIDRSGISGFDHPLFTSKFSTNALIETTGVFGLEVVFDKTILEVFLQGGQTSATTTLYPLGRVDTLTISADGLNDIINLGVTVWALSGTW